MTYLDIKRIATGKLLTEASTWSKKTPFVISLDSSMKTTWKKSYINFIFYSFTINALTLVNTNDFQISNSTEEKLVGIKFNSEFCCENHVSSLCNKANSM